MATSLLINCSFRSAFKILSLQALGLRGLPSALYLCTKPGDSKKDSQKNKGEVKTNTKPDAAVKLTDEDLRKFMQRKTLVMFPQKAEFPFKKKPVWSSTEGLRKMPANQELSSSSSSGSDSSSDSEDDHDSKEKIKSKIHFPKQVPISSEDKSVMIKIRKKKQFAPDHVKDRTFEKLLFSSRANNQPPKERLTERYLKSKNLGIQNKETQKPVKPRSSSEHLEASFSEATLPKFQVVPPQNRSKNLTLRPDEDITKEVQKMEMQDKDSEVPEAEVSRERLPAAETVAKEEISLEAGVQIKEQSTPQETKPLTETAEETHDISTYKNLQHHEYQTFTFVDFDVLLSKFRLPQPSSGRLSPTH